jgi:hypothetical protein
MSQEGQINTFRRSCLVLETMDYQGGDAKSFSKELARLGIIEKPLGRPIKPLGYAKLIKFGAPIPTFESMVEPIASSDTGSRSDCGIWRRFRNDVLACFFN